MKRFTLLFVLLQGCLGLYGQMYILNEDFSSASGTTPPLEWTSILISGSTSDIWHFDNPGNQDIAYPIIAPFAIFDAGYYSNNFQVEEVALQSPSFDASISNFIFLEFDHTYISGNGSSVKIQAFNGTDWFDVKVYNTDILDVTHAIVDISTYTGGTTNARLRFIWSGNGSGYWALDNVKIYGALPYDAGVISLDNPVVPFNEGVHPLRISLKNFGYYTLTDVEIHWSVDAIQQPVFNWNGILVFGQTQTDIQIGTFNFQKCVKLKVWPEYPNGQSDPNPYNDTAMMIICPTLCGEYTIGGIEPDFGTFTDAVNTLKTAGISCPVVFQVRPGTYNEQIEVDSIVGASDINTITFQAEDGDSTSVLLTYEGPSGLTYLVQFNNAHFVNLKKLRLSVSSDYGAMMYRSVLKFSNESSHINILNCNISAQSYLEGPLLKIATGSNHINIKNNYISGGVSRGVMFSASGSRYIQFESNIVQAYSLTNSDLIVFSNAQNISVESNKIQNCPISQSSNGISFTSCELVNVANNWFKNNDWNWAINFTSSINDTIADNIIDNSHTIHLNGNNNCYCVGNRIINAKNINGLYVKAGSSIIANNYIQVTGESVCAGLQLENQTDQSIIVFNSINVSNSNENSTALGILGSSEFMLKNNIFSNVGSGFAIKATLTNFNSSWDHNNYFKHLGKFAYVNNLMLDSLEQWRVLTNSDAASLSVNPYFYPDTLPAIHQSFLNNVGTPIATIVYDIDSTLRNSLTPDIGAKEYTPCAIDAGIESISSPKMPVSAGLESVKVILHNHGTEPLTSVQIHYSANGVLQTDTTWYGLLLHNQTTEVGLGSYDFSLVPLAILRAWTTEPNGTVDCQPENNSTLAYPFAAPLCGEYTIGGIEPDFGTFTDAVNTLKTAGISCPVVFQVRPGTYNEQIEVDSIVGASDINTITFQAEDGDSTSVLLTYEGPSGLTYLVQFNNAHFVNLKKLRLSVSSDYGAMMYRSVLKFSNESSHINILNCNISAQSYLEGPLLKIATGSNHINIKNNYISGGVSRGVMFSASGSRYIQFESNIVQAYSLTNSDLIVFSNAQNISVESNKIQNCPISQSSNGISFTSCELVNVANNWFKNNDWNWAINFTSSINDTIADNIIDNSKGIIIDGSLNDFIVNNQIIDLRKGHGIVTNSGNSLIANNYIRLNTDNNLSCIRIDSESNENIIVFNSLIVKNVSGTSLLINNSNSQIIKNNIFYNTNSGFPVVINVINQNLEIDYNNYFSTSGILGKYLGTTYSTPSSWASAINGEANSRNLNPYFANDSTYKVYQRGINGAGIPVSGILLDIEGKIRNDQAPDIGVWEFTVDFGVTDLISPTLDCFHPEPDSIIVFLRQFGDIPFIDLKLAWQVNNDTIHYDTIPGSIYNDLLYTFTTTVDMSQEGEYYFKVWLINALDDNINNDTLKAWRYSKPAPLVSLLYDNLCTGREVKFYGQASISEPYFIESYEWFFGDGATSLEQNPIHIYEQSGTYTVIFRAYSNSGCYSSTTTDIYIDPDYIPLSITLDVNDEICENDGDGKITVNAANGYPPYFYFLNDQQQDGPVFSGLSTGSYIVKVTDNQGCSLSDTVDILTTVYLNPIIHADPLSGFAPITVNFDFTCDNADSWIWHFTETISDTTRSPSYTFWEYGYHRILLEVNSGSPYYCTDTASILIYTDIRIIIDYNNFFTPDGDGINDFFEITSFGLQSMNVKIYDRWGIKVYEITEVDGKWDGTTNSGKEALDGVYYFVLKATGVDGLDYERQGSITLIRDIVDAYPNPVNDKINLKVGDQFGEEITIQLFSLEGQERKILQISKSDIINIDISDVPDGFYIVRLTDGIQFTHVKILKVSN